MIPVHGDSVVGGAAGHDELDVGVPGVGGGAGARGQPALLHGQGQVPNSVDMALNIQFIVQCNLLGNED